MPAIAFGARDQSARGDATSVPARHACALRGHRARRVMPLPRDSILILQGFAESARIERPPAGKPCRHRATLGKLGLSQPALSQIVRRSKRGSAFGCLVEWVRPRFGRPSARRASRQIRTSSSLRWRRSHSQGRPSNEAWSLMWWNSTLTRRAVGCGSIRKKPGTAQRQ